MKSSLCSLFAATIVMSLAGIAHGQLLISDQFNRTGPLNGTAPTYSATPETWTADASVTTDGTEGVVTTFTAPAGPERTTAYLGIPGLTGPNLTVGGTYTLSFTVNKLSGDSWMAVGFGTATNTADVSFQGGNSSGFWALDNGGGLNIFDEVGGSINDLGELGISGSTDVVMTIHVGASSDSLNATVNGSPVSLSTSSIDVDPISQVFFGGYQTMGTVQNLTLDGPIAAPEPSTWAMLLVGLAFLGCYIRRKSRLLP